MDHSSFLVTATAARAAVTYSRGIAFACIAFSVMASLFLGCGTAETVRPRADAEATKREIAASVAQARSLIKSDAISRLYARDFEHLEHLLQGLQVRYERDFLNEVDLQSLLTLILDLGEPEAEAYFSEWIQQYPRTYPARLARGVYYVGMGWQARGRLFAEQLTPHQIEGMRAYFAKGTHDLEKALDMNPRLLSAHAYLINLHMNLSPPGVLAAYKDRALALDPYSVMVRWNYVLSLTPLWGGSVEQVELFARATAPYMEANPHLRFIGGAPAMARGQVAILQKPPRHSDVILRYSEAISFGDHWSYYFTRGDAYAMTQQWNLAVRDYEKVVQIRPSYRDVHPFLVYARRRAQGS